MFSVFVPATAAEEDFLVAALWEAGTLGLTEEPGGMRAFFAAESDLRNALKLLDRELKGIRKEEDTDWVQRTYDAFPPTLLGERFYLTPPWDPTPTPVGRLRLEVTPGRVCGTGYHPCTQLCLEAMERFVHAGSSVLDVGSGSGILMKAAKLLEASRVIGCDIDAEAVGAAREQIPLAMFVGSVEAVRSHSMDVIVANISAAAVDDLWSEFRRVLNPKTSTLLLSGFQTRDIDPAWYAAETIQKAEWALRVVRNL